MILFGKNGEEVNCAPDQVSIMESAGYTKTKGEKKTEAKKVESEPAKPKREAPKPVKKEA